MKRFQYSNDCYSPIVPEEIKKILLYQFDVPEELINVDEPYETMGLGSIDLVELMLAVEE
jgi:acyl carrier protein